MDGALDTVGAVDLACPMGVRNGVWIYADFNLDIRCILSVAFVDVSWIHRRSRREICAYMLCTLDVDSPDMLLLRPDF
jgi:hypothetical protein